ncbi:MAG: isopentenyl-diphosphate Delta-isomerase [Proteobacteria bacterium]|nr:isopentenyl-diphosphate Delta-isomerase [Pseudomonadota bacterium]MBU1585940.1 isopentenyl-diphosphate Delta-isomerase [Pseudomonadota bacterium]MBU2453895.1 isopentenyl-diphosphate Delta-isomerase [Pseudomonadota bacterium]MBU2628277.1 isopentenyl-diphosphate Delta-isomerase [Pseudomonadota bacterium]
MDPHEEYVVLVDEKDQEIGIRKKQIVHTNKTPLHRAFSLFLFKSTKELLLQQRAKEKITWPLVWSNSCCGHPLPEESYKSAVKRRTRQELGVELSTLIKISDFRYCFSKDGVMENEICPIFVGRYDGKVMPNPQEVQAIKWIQWNDWLKETVRYPGKYSPWCVEETRILSLDKPFNRWHA